MDYGQMLGGMPPQQPTAPTMQQPGGGMPQQPQDQSTYESSVVVQSLQRLAEMWRQSGDEEGGIVCDKAAIDLKRHRMKRQKKLQQQIQDAQATILPQMM